MDAIVGAARLMHTVITDECTGCDLCVEPCPVDCIDMLPIAEASASRPATAPQAEAATARAMAQHARNRFQARQQRLRQEKVEKEQRRQARRATHCKQHDSAVPMEPSSASRAPQAPETPANHTGTGENEFRDAGLVALSKAIKSHGGVARWSAEFGLPQKTGSRGGHVYWTKERIESELRRRVAGRDHYPMQKEAESEGWSNLYATIDKRREHNFWAQRFDLPRVRNRIARPGQTD